jgi:hypothetical protein
MCNAHREAYSIEHQILVDAVSSVLSTQPLSRFLPTISRASWQAVEQHIQLKVGNMSMLISYNTATTVPVI